MYTVFMSSTEFGCEQFGTHEDVESALNQVSRLVNDVQAVGDGIERQVGIIVNQE